MKPKAQKEEESKACSLLKFSFNFILEFNINLEANPAKQVETSIISYDFNEGFDDYNPQKITKSQI